MFQVEPILWLQSVMPPVLSWILWLITELGRGWLYVLLLFAVGFGLRLRPALALLTLLALNNFLTEGLKEGFGLPRPRLVEVDVVEPHQTEVAPLVEHGGAPGFWSLPTEEAISAVRAEPDINFGLPSGHTSTALAFTVGLALFFRLRWAWILAGVWVPLMMISRMYMGAHFLADTLGGLVVGAAAVVLAGFLLGPLGNDDRGPEPPLSALKPLGLVGIAVLLALPFIEILEPTSTGRLAGVIVAWMLLLRMGLPADGGDWKARVARILLVVGLYVAADFISGKAVEAIGSGDVRMVLTVATALVPVAALAGTVWVSRRWGWYAAA